MSLIAHTVTDEKDLRDIYRLRYKVFCFEWGFEKPENYPDEIVTDVYDLNALHFAVRNDTGKIVGAVSLILDSPEGFPAEKYCELDFDPGSLPRKSIAEISRLVIHRDYRRRTEDKYIYGPDEERRSIGNVNYTSYSGQMQNARRADDRYKYKGARRAAESYSERRRRHEVVISLYKALYQETKRRQITHWYAVMTKGIVLLLDRFGIKFEAIGDPVDYRGIRTPYLGDIEKIERGIVEKNPELFEEMRGGL